MESMETKKDLVEFNQEFTVIMGELESPPPKGNILGLNGRPWKKR